MRPGLPTTSFRRYFREFVDDLTLCAPKKVVIMKVACTHLQSYDRDKEAIINYHSYY